MSKPLGNLFGITVSYNEALERWVAIDNRDQKTIGYGEKPMEAFDDYIIKSTAGEEYSE
jgi:hypothetical protein